MCKMWNQIKTATLGIMAGFDSGFGHLFKRTQFANCLYLFSSIQVKTSPKALFSTRPVLLLAVSANSLANNMSKTFSILSPISGRPHSSLVVMGGQSSAPLTASSLICIGSDHPLVLGERCTRGDDTSKDDASLCSPPSPKISGMDIPLALEPPTPPPAFFIAIMSFVKMRISRSVMRPKRNRTSSAGLTHPSFFGGGFWNESTCCLMLETFCSTTFPKCRMTCAPSLARLPRESSPLRNGGRREAPPSCGLPRPALTPFC
mmetsp:Transcript_22880/g.46470  ORF Transcript_22880/g.46470 Transcript_22880/m.46470 type:complete len:261 (-) Transcript_22880:1134-1916(-)